MRDLAMLKPSEPVRVTPRTTFDEKNICFMILHSLRDRIRTVQGENRLCVWEGSGGDA